MKIATILFLGLFVYSNSYANPRRVNVPVPAPVKKAKLYLTNTSNQTISGKISLVMYELVANGSSLVRHIKIKGYTDQGKALTCVINFNEDKELLGHSLFNQLERLKSDAKTSIYCRGNISTYSNNSTIGINLNGPVGFKGFSITTYN
ncbi:MAG: hypothetical protein ISR65_17655 [Bacteriovoracaceae bacterium]|nr:hypothetical protein [Bacteriovoracaceae bacterium]